MVSATDGTNQVDRTIIIKVEDANDPPVINPIHHGVEDEVYSGRLSFGDEDGDPVTFRKTVGPVPSKMAQSLCLIMRITLLPHPSCKFASTDTFTASISDRDITVTPVVQIFLAPVNDPPVAEDDYVYYTDLKRSNRLQFNVLTNDHSGVDKADENYTLISTLRLIMPPVFPIWEMEPLPISLWILGGR